ncbi:hypothetical protein KEM54_004611 [Ascosphaera aggregata]|nr:hypothetical protein KEM54_004611 [Ascosphaera aggregata]
MENPDQWYNLDEIRGLFSEGTKFFLTIGTWGDSSGFEQASRTPESRKEYADNVARILTDQGFDGVDIDWEYPGGHGADYKIHNNVTERKQEVINYPKFLQAIRDSIGQKKLSIAVPGKQEDMMAFNKDTARNIFNAVDYVNIMSYDLTNRRSKVTGHLSSVQGSLESVENYLSLGLDPSKANLGFPFYAEYYTMQPGCTNPDGLGCPIVAAEDSNGMDSKTSGVLTFQAENFAKPASNLTMSQAGKCGYLAGMKCQSGYCCSTDGWCGITKDYCGMSCTPGYGTCLGITAIESFKAASQNTMTDNDQGAVYAIDTQHELFWTWDSPDFYQRKFDDIVKPYHLGGVMAWSLGQDSMNWAHITKMIQLSRQTFA